MRMVLRRKETNYLRMRRAKLNRKDFKKIKTIGLGAFGEVSLVRSLINSSKPGGLYAMKTLKKNEVVERKQVAHVIAEKDILAESENEWIVKLYYSFQVKIYKVTFVWAKQGLSHDFWTNEWVRFKVFFCL
jgi:serine/threonine protein kinase